MALLPGSRLKRWLLFTLAAPVAGKAARSGAAALRKRRGDNAVSDRLEQAAGLLQRRRRGRRHGLLG